jgi:hypothetical protein
MNDLIEKKLVCNLVEVTIPWEKSRISTHSKHNLQNSRHGR